MSRAVSAGDAARVVTGSGLGGALLRHGSLQGSWSGGSAVENVRERANAPDDHLKWQPSHG
ncbi:hypothetical protein C8E95_3423 [Pseudonocardia autotrophica]|uniref:Uncharacterized protein n=1 Tax=Pseudonocardia autotrophica TaxID=2074 RepID=A0A1Y2N914_PSEAH|nr:hypothetical protein BG845_00082 [Pseudonocardia autotrophica]TDN74305.1 hypothetical protein C8E95_3423 [Pseudonocardia autotrophica]